MSTCFLVQNIGFLERNMLRYFGDVLEISTGCQRHKFVLILDSTGILGKNLVGMIKRL
jgi:hypothetical protein